MRPDFHGSVPEQKSPAGEQAPSERRALRGPAGVLVGLLMIIAGAVGLARLSAVPPAEVPALRWAPNPEVTGQLVVARSSPYIDVWDFGAEDGDVVRVGDAEVLLRHVPARFYLPPGTPEVRLTAVKDGYGGITAAVRSSEGQVRAGAHRPGDVIIVPVIWR